MQLKVIRDLKGAVPFLMSLVLGSQCQKKPQALRCNIILLFLDSQLKLLAVHLKAQNIDVHSEPSRLAELVSDQSLSQHGEQL